MGKTKIFVTGCPIGGATEKVIKAIKDNGGAVEVILQACHTYNIETKGIPSL